MSADLFEDHRTIIAAADELLAALRQKPRQRMDDLSQARVRLSSLAMAHLRAEDAQIVAPLMASGRIADLPEAAAIVTEIREGRSVYSEHIRKWSPQAIDADWDAYVQDVGQLVDFVKALLAREEKYLYLPVLKLLDLPASQSRTG